MAFGRLGHIFPFVVLAAVACGCTSVVPGAPTYVGDGPAPTTAEVTEDPTYEPPPSTSAAPPTNDDAGTCILIMLAATSPNLSYIAMADGSDPSKTPESVAQEFDDAANTVEAQAATIVDPALKSAVDGMVAAMRTTAQELRDGTNYDNSAFVTAATAVSDNCTS